MNEVLVRARAALSRGDVFSAYDLATEDATGDPALAEVEVRALVGMGDWQGALRRYGEAGLDARRDVEAMALKGRILKDAAFAAPAGERAARFAEAAAAYAAAWTGAGDYYAAINAAATAALAGDQPLARGHAQRALDDARNVPRQDYWAVATQAEALLLLGRASEAEATLARAIACDGATSAARNGTYRQLRALLEVGVGAGQGFALDPVLPPRTAHLSGHMFTSDPVAEARIAREAERILREERVGVAFGALACGADIVLAETCLALGIEFHAVLPFDTADFLALSVRPGGPEWEARFEACIAGAARTTHASAMRYVGDDTQFASGSEFAMGLARLRAARLGSEAVQLCVWDGVAPTGVAGAGADVARWTGAGGRTARIGGEGLRRAANRNGAGAGIGLDRALRVLVFCDYRGFSRLPEPLMPAFWTEIMGRCAKVLAPKRARISCRNTWGDALYLAFDQVRPAAEALVELRDAIAEIDGDAIGLPPGSGMRIAAHYGSVYEISDPVTGMPNYYGTEVSRAARVEPITPPGQVYVTEPMAAIMAMDCADSFVCRYVGRLALAKDYGIERVYRLERLVSNQG